MPASKQMIERGDSDGQLRPAAGVRRRARKDAGRLRKAFLASALLVAAAMMSGSFAGAGSDSADSPSSTAGESCPRGTRSLPGDALAGATRAALREAPHLYSGVDTRDRRATIAALATVDGARGRQVRGECGPRVQRRTVVVMLEFPHLLPSASLSQGTVFVARVGRRYRVWEVAH
jgi:hypothetical protein